MSAPDPTKIRRIPGKIIASPTGNDPANNHGGTVLGAVTGCWFDPGLRYEAFHYDELGKAGDVYALYDEPLLYMAFRSWDSDVLAKLFPSTSSEVVTLGGLGVISLAATIGRPILYAPDDPAAPGVYLNNAVPITDTSERGLDLSILREAQIYAMFMGLPATIDSGLAGKMGPVASIL